MTKTLEAKPPTEGDPEAEHENEPLDPLLPNF